MSEDRIPSIDEQGRRLAEAFARHEERGASRPRRRTLIPIAVAACALGLVVLAIGVGRGESGSNLSLDEAIAAVARASFEAPGNLPGKTTYAHSSFESVQNGFSTGIGSFIAHQRMDMETWYSGGAKGWTRWTMYPARFPTLKDRENHQKVLGGGRLAKRDLRKHVTVCHGGTAQRVSTPGDPAVKLNLRVAKPFPSTSRGVYALMGRSLPKSIKSRERRKFAIWTQIANAMQFSGLDLDADQRAAVVGALAEIPGVKTLGRVDDPNGVPAIGFELNSNDGKFRNRVYFDAATGVTTYQDGTVLKQTPRLEVADPDRVVETQFGYPDVPAGTIVSKYQLLDFKHIDSAPKLKESAKGSLRSGFCRH